MPPDRTAKAAKRSINDGTQLIWTLPVEPSSPNSIAFAPNVTPGTFNDPPPMVDPPCESILFPPPTDNSVPARRPGHSKKKPENHIPRPPNAFILFRSSFIKSQHVSTEVETNHSTLSKIIGLTWQNLPHTERQIWHAKAKAALDEHKRKFPQYAFRPLHTKGKGSEKRKVREVGPKDLKRCAKIAELLVEGKKGQELDAAIQEFDRHHVPEVITRFETPLTARQYRRSSSAPVPDSADTFPTSAKGSLVRASSSQPTRCPSPPSVVERDSAETFCPSASPYTPSSTYSFPSTPDPTCFDFDLTFGTTAMGPCAPHSPCGSLESIAASIPIYQQHTSSQPSLSINTSFVDDWARSSSPTSMNSIPATPESYSDASSPSESGSSCLQSPLDSCGDRFATAFGFDSLHQVAAGMGKSFVDLETLQYSGEDGGVGCIPIESSVSIQTGFEAQHGHTPAFHMPSVFDESLSHSGDDFEAYPMIHATGCGLSDVKSSSHLDLDFATFMQSYHI